MAYLTAIWKNDTDEWFRDVDLTTVLELMLIDNSGQLYTVVEGELVNVEGVQEVSMSIFEGYGVTSSELSDVSVDEWSKLSGNIDILAWTEDIDVRRASVITTQNIFAKPELKLTIPEYTLLDDLERPIKVITYSDGDEVPILRSEYEAKGISTRIMKRGE